MTKPRISLEPGARTAAGAIALSEPNITGNEWAYVKECLDSGWVSTAGTFVGRFEREFARRLGVRYAVAMGSGTAALHIALLVSGVEPEDEVVVPALTFIAPVNAVRYVGAWPAIVDVETAHWQMDPAELATFLARDCERKGGSWYNRHTGRRVRAVLPVDLLGHPCDHDALRETAREYDLLVVEDATESLGARYRDRPLGQLSPISCFSFNGNKVITCGGGGMLVTDEESWATRARYLATQAKDDALEYIHFQIGYNYRLTNVQAAMGCAQLERLDEFVDRKRALADRYARGLADVAGIATPTEAPWAFSTFWLYTVLVDPEVFRASSRDLLQALARARIQARPLWQPMHRSAAHAGAYSRPCPVAEHIHARALSLPSSSGLSESDQARVIAAIHEVAG